MDDYSDDNLREQLKAYGQDVGPINNSTRPYWKKALSKLLMEHGVSPIACESKKGSKKKKLVCEKKKCVGSLKGPVHYSKCTDRSFSEDDLSGSENDSVVKDSPGRTPFPAKAHCTKESSLKETSTSKTKTSPVESLRRYANRRNCHHSTTPNSTRNNRVKHLDNGLTIGIQQKDKKLREDLKEYGKSLHYSPMNDAIRNQWKRRLNKLRSRISPVRSSTDNYHLEDYEDEFEDENEFYVQNPHQPERHLKEFAKMCFTFVLKGILGAFVLIVGVYLMVSPEDIKRIEESLD